MSHFAITSKSQDEVLSSPDKDLELLLLTNIINESRPDAQITPQQLERNFTSDRLWAVAYAEILYEEQQYIKKNYKIQVTRNNQRPIGIMETLSVNYDDFSLIPIQYKELMSQAVDSKVGDRILIITDYDIIANRYAKTDRRDALNNMLGFIFSQAGELGFEYLLTYLPENSDLYQLPLMKSLFPEVGDGAYRHLPVDGKTKDIKILDLSLCVKH